MTIHGQNCFSSEVTKHNKGRTRAEEENVFIILSIAKKKLRNKSNK